MTPRIPLRLALLLSAILVSCSDPNEPDQSPVGQLRLATSATSLVFYQVSPGASHTCAVTTDSRAYCWGDNSGGKLGDGTTTDRPTPVAVAGGLRFHSISAGYLTTCGVTTDQRAYCWGYNGVGTIGDGTTTTRLKPVPIMGGRRFSQIETSISHTCGVSYPDHRAYCWGSNLDGELGDGTRDSHVTPVAVAGALLIRQVSVGTMHTCAVTTSNLAYCWGNNAYGQLGDSTNIYRRSKPSRVVGAHQFRMVDAGNYHACAVTTGDRAFCWGRGNFGQLGDGKTHLSYWPRAVAGGLYFTRVTGCGYHTCGETQSNQAFCWGNGRFGQLGNGATTQRLTPVLVAGGHSFKQVSAGYFHTCGKTSSSEAYCWGEGLSGKLGNGGTASSSTPVRVSGS